MRAGRCVFSAILVFLPLALVGCGGSSGNQPIISNNPTPSPTGTITEFPLNSGIHPRKIMKGPDGNMWSMGIGPDIGEVARITPDGTVTRMTILGLTDITFGPDGNLWYVTSAASTCCLNQMTIAGMTQSFPEPSAGFQIAVGPDNNLWVTGNVGTAFEFDVYSTAGTFLHSFAISPSPDNGTMTNGPDGNLWFVSNNALRWQR